MRATRWDYVFDLQGLLRSGLITFGARGVRKVGFATAREGSTLFYRERITPSATAVHAVARNLELVAQAIGVAPVYEPPLWRLPPAALAAADDLWRESDFGACSAVLAIGPASRWPSKTWPPAFFAAVLRLVQAGYPGRLGIWLAGAPDERSLGEAVLAAGVPTGTANWMGRTDLPTLVALLGRSQGMLTNDSGPMHIAAALDVPTVALFGPTDPAKTGPYGPRNRVVQTAVDCAPCMQRDCPLPRQLCLSDVATPEHVAQVVLNRLLHGGA